MKLETSYRARKQKGRNPQWRENPKTGSMPTATELAIRAEKTANGHRTKRFLGSQSRATNSKNGITGIEYLEKSGISLPRSPPSKWKHAKKLK
jgi:hypothetical protein